MRRLALIVAVLALAVTVTVIVRRDLGHAKLIATLREPGGQRAKAAAFSPDGKMLAVLGRNGDTYMWDVAAGRWTATFTSPQCRGSMMCRSCSARTGRRSPSSALLTATRAFGTWPRDGRAPS